MLGKSLALALPLLLGAAHAFAVEPVCHQMERLGPSGDHYLWLPDRARFFTEAAATQFREDHQITLYRTAKPWRVPANPTWREDPFDSVTWQLFYNSLGWLYAPIYDYVHHGDVHAGEVAKTLLIGWLKTHKHDVPSDAFAQWIDQSAAYRLAYLGDFRRLLAPLLTQQENEAILESAKRHAAYLSGLFTDEKKYLGNHGFMDAMAVYSAGIATKNHEWVARARDRVKVVFDSMMVEGVSHEQSFGYETYDIKLMIEAQCLSEYNDYEDLPGVLDQIRSAIDLMALVMLPDRTIPAVGDTYYKMTASPLEKYLGPKTLTPTARYVWSNGKDGAAPPELTVLESAGYGIIRSDDTRVIFDFSDAPSGHGHEDNLNFIFYANGHRMVIDPGGPYGYHTDLWNNFFRAAGGHNLVLVDGQRQSAAAEFVDAGTTPMPWITAKKELPGVTHTRTLMLAGNSTLIVRDDLRSEEEHSYQLLLHLPPEAVIETGEEATATIGDSTLMIKVAAEKPLHPTVRDGWVTPDNSKKIEAPVLAYDHEGSNVEFTTILHSSSRIDLDAIDRDAIAGSSHVDP